jgi:hypothetical protein
MEAVYLQFRFSANKCCPLFAIQSHALAQPFRGASRDAVHAAAVAASLAIVFMLRGFVVGGWDASPLLDDLTKT